MRDLLPRSRGEVHEAAGRHPAEGVIRAPHPLPARGCGGGASGVRPTARRARLRRPAPVRGALRSRRTGAALHRRAGGRAGQPGIHRLPARGELRLVRLVLDEERTDAGDAGRGGCGCARAKGPGSGGGARSADSPPPSSRSARRAPACCGSRSTGIGGACTIASRAPWSKWSRRRLDPCGGIAAALGRGATRASSRHPYGTGLFPARPRRRAGRPRSPFSALDATATRPWRGTPASERARSTRDSGRTRSQPCRRPR